jgi:hypothetical protein
MAVATDLFGRPLFDAPRAKQPPLFDARHWFGLGYRDAATGVRPAPGQRGYAENLPAYVEGIEAGRRDLAAGRHGEEGEARAWAQAKAVGNVRE